MEYFDYSNVFLVKNTIEFSKNSRINKHIIESKKDKQPPFRFIYNLRLLKLEILKIYIEINLANGFIRFFKSFARAIYLF